MRIRKPSAGTVLGGLALFVAMGGTAMAATGSVVNIADGSDASRVAHVDSSGKLLVGDGSGALTVDGTVQESSPANFWRASGIGGATCAVIGAPPSGKAVVLKGLTLNVYGAPSAGFGPNGFIAFYNNKTCGGSPIWDVTPTALGPTPVTFSPGIGIPSTAGLSVVDYNGNGYEFEVYANGYLVSSSAVPSGAADTGGPVRGSRTGPPAAAR